MSRRFEIRYDRWCGWMLGALGMGRRFSGVHLDADSVTVRMGWAFRLTVPRSSLVDVAPDDERVWGWGVHGWSSRWLVNGSSAGLVRLQLEPAAKARIIGVPWHVDTVRVSVDDRDALLTALRA